MRALKMFLLRHLLSMMLAIFAIFACCVALSVGEGVVRLAGHQPWTSLPRFDGIPTVTQFDAALGWTNRPGHYRVSAVPGMVPVNVTIDQRGSRITNVPVIEDPTSDEIWAMGCSLTYGWGVGDNETFASVTNSLLRGMGASRSKVQNFGVAGYGTLQSWRLFQRQTSTNRSPGTVLYGYFSGHAERNLALPTFTRTLDRAASRQAWVAMPYVRTGTEDHGLIFYPPTRYMRWPGAEHSGLINLAQETADAFVRARLYPSAYTATRQLILDFSDDAKSRGAKFVVLLLYLSEDDLGVREFLADHKIAYLDLTNLGFPGPGKIIEGDGHPNASMHKIWGLKIAEYLSATSGVAAKAAQSVTESR